MIFYVVQSIKKRWLRSSLTITALAGLLSLVIVVSGIIDYQKATMNEHASAGGAGKIVIQSFTAGENYPTLVGDLSESIGNSILEYPMIQKDMSANILFFGLKAPLYPGEPPEVLLTGIDENKVKAFTGSIASETKVIKGNLQFSNTQAQECIIGAKAFEVLTKEQGQITVGSMIEFIDEYFTIVGILEVSQDKVVNNAIIVPIKTLQRLIDKEMMISATIVYLNEVKDMDLFIQQVTAMNGKLNFVTSETISRNAEEGIRLFENMINGIRVAVLVIAILILITVMSITVNERTKEIGILKALGAKNRMVNTIIVYEMLFIATMGCIVATIISGYVLRYMMAENLFDILIIAKYLPAAYIVTIIAAIVPVIRITRIDPIKALRYE
ncbi:MAG: ABC transporter permease [Clostridiales bacterium]|nr:ABC transporter permease [Clostridiales bacterium]